MNVKERLKSVAKKIMPEPVYHRLGATSRRIFQGVGKVDMGSFKRLTPISRQWGMDRGLPINRYYIENFLARHRGDIHGHVLEIEDASYTQKYGGSRVTKSDILHVKEGAPGATIIADLTYAKQIPSNTFDCLIVTQTLQLIYDMRSAVKTMERILKPSGVALVTVPGLDPALDEEWASSWYWTLTIASATRLFEEAFPAERVQVEAWGNVLAATAFLQGLATEELTKEQLDYVDPAYQVVVAVRAVKPEGSQ
jgi:hypothetical protein